MKYLGAPQSGSQANTTASRNRNGQYYRNRSIPVNPSSIYQQAVRSRMQQNADAWKLLTSTQREGWAALGYQMSRTDGLGQTYDLTGFQAYCSVNLNQLNVGNSVLSDAPLFSIPAPILTLTVTLTSAAFSIAWTPTPMGAGERIMIFASGMVSAGRAFNADYKFIAASAAAGASPLVILSAYQARIGTPVTGARIFVSAQRYSGGFVSTPIQVSQVVA